MIEKPFEDISKNDIDALIVNAVSESRSIEYKQELPGTTDGEKKEFLADISSFANAAGGDVLFGITEKKDEYGKKTGEPEYIKPLEGVTSDEAMLRIEEILRQGIQPRLRVHIKAIIGWGDDGKDFIILVRVPKSFASPHMVVYKNSSRFYSRNSSGKYQLDIDEIRSSILATDSQASRITRFLEVRLGQIVADETPVRLSTPHRLILHVVPIPTFLNRERVTFSNVANLSEAFRPIGTSGWNHRFNLDGYLTWCPERNFGEGCRSYCQLFFDGTIEAVFSDLLRTHNGGKVNGGTGFIASVAYEEYVITALRSYFSGYKKLGIEAPIAISMAILGCKGSYMAVGFSGGWGDTHPIDRDTALFPEVMVDDLDVDIPQIMKPIFDAVWNACGYSASSNYDTSGKWNPRR